MEEGKEFVTLGQQVGNLLEAISELYPYNGEPSDDELRDILEILTKEPEDGRPNAERVAASVAEDFSCDDFSTAHLAKTALKWLGPKKEDKPKQTKRKPGRPRKTTK